MNPYLVPGLDTRPDGPLCPFHTPEHERYYVPVDKTQEAFEHFKEQMGDLRNLRSEGRLIVASGKPGCGKTALINRCAAWLQDSLKDLGIQGIIFSLTHECAENQAVHYRVNHVFRCVADDLLRHRKLSDEDHVRGLKERRDDLRLAYRYLSSVLDRDLVTIVLLPPSADLVKEVATYTQFAYPNIVFFAESSYVDELDSSWPDICRVSLVPPIRLEVGPLGERDGWLFAQTRQENYPDSPRVSEETMRLVTAGETSIRRLQALLFGVYRELNHRPRPENTVMPGEVTYEYITNYHFRLTWNEAGRIP